MNIRLIICVLILIDAVEINADSGNIQITENMQDIVEYSVQQEIIKLPWSDCTEVNKLFEKKFSFSEKQIKKENKIYEEYRKFSLNHNNPNNFSMQFREKENENAKTEMLIKFFLSFLETNNSSKSPNYPVIFLKKQEELLKRELEDQINYRKKYDNNILFPSSK